MDFSSNHSISHPPPVVISPCAACKILRRRCNEKCVLAPYFPPTNPLKFTTAHRVFGASNIIKMLQELPEYQRDDAVSSMVYEANARIRDPVYGCAGIICLLHKQMSDLQTELAKAQAEILNMQCQQANLLALINCNMEEMKIETHSPTQVSSESEDSLDHEEFMNSIVYSLLEPETESLWTRMDISYRGNWMDEGTQTA